ncbi:MULTISPECIES: hypothetical protein [Streptomyces]|nr:MULTISPECIES: hypothetical protein [Streptomyces]MYS96262.1 hypothetical protein [Streptomyces sp. SID5469]BBJ48124.1 hypothetical protein SAVMC3_07530 [Streptomyces avermitilis]GDY69506.1 hypothetical protein SAV14893_088990 [Streptomyces avermitilis]GDY79760.1 hypothetical protein SAV31267_092450 [Streptomyces avermitilis]
MMNAAAGAVLLFGCLYEEAEEGHDAEPRTQRTSAPCRESALTDTADAESRSERP